MQEEAIFTYLDDPKPQCEAKVPNYAERKAAREQGLEERKDGQKRKNLACRGRKFNPPRVVRVLFTKAYGTLL